MHERPASGRGDQDLASAGGPVLERIFSRPINLKSMVGVLKGRDCKSAPGQFGNKADEQRGLSRTAPARQSDHAHGRLERETARAYPGRLREARIDRRCESLRLIRPERAVLPL